MTKPGGSVSLTSVSPRGRRAHWRRARIWDETASKLDCTFTGPCRSSNVPSATRTKTVEPTEVIPPLAMMFLHWVPLPQTHLGNSSTAYLVSFRNLHSSLDASSSHSLMSASAGISLQSDPSSTTPCTQYGFPVAKDL